MTSRLRELRQRLADTAFWEERRRLPDRIQGYEMAAEDFAPVIEAAERFLRAIPDDEIVIARVVWGNSNVAVVQTAKTQLRDALAEWGGE